MSLEYIGTIAVKPTLKHWDRANINQWSQSLRFTHHIISNVDAGFSAEQELHDFNMVIPCRLVQSCVPELHVKDTEAFDSLFYSITKQVESYEQHPSKWHKCDQEW